MQEVGTTGLSPIPSVAGAGGSSPPRPRPTFCEHFVPAISHSRVYLILNLIVYRPWRDGLSRWDDSTRSPDSTGLRDLTDCARIATTTPTPDPERRIAASLQEISQSRRAFLSFEEETKTCLRSLRSPRKSLVSTSRRLACRVVRVRSGYVPSTPTHLRLAGIGGGIHSDRLVSSATGRHHTARIVSEKESTASISMEMINASKYTSSILFQRSM